MSRKGLITSISIRDTSGIDQKMISDLLDLLLE